MFYDLMARSCIAIRPHHARLPEEKALMGRRTVRVQIKLVVPYGHSQGTRVRRPTLNFCQRTGCRDSALYPPLKGS
jgi:hypothetical protein